MYHDPKVLAFDKRQRATLASLKQGELMNLLSVKLAERAEERGFRDFVRPLTQLTDSLKCEGPEMDSKTGKNFWKYFAKLPCWKTLACM